MLNTKSGQSTIEYILLVTAVIAVMIVFTTGNNQSGLKGKVLNTYNGIGDNMGTRATKLTDAQKSNAGSVPTAQEQGFQVDAAMPAAQIQ